MAIELATKTPYGVPARYHRVAHLTVNYTKRYADAQLVSYATENARQTGAEPLATENIRVQFERLGTDEPTRAKIYAALKATEAYKDGVDV